MSKSLITDSFPIKKRSEQITQKFSQSKAKRESIQKQDGQKLDYPEAKDVRDLNVLKDFDTRCEYGPCLGITRLQRWKRAEEQDLNPPHEVKEIIEKNRDDPRYTECLWHEELM